jgi:phage terminase large subunit-like protein
VPSDQVSVRVDEDLRAAVRTLTRETGLTESAIVREALIKATGHAREPLSLRWSWCLADFREFCEGGEGWPGLELPEGHAFRLEGHALLILREVFATGRVELLVLLPKGNGKTALLAALAVFHLLTVQNANCYLGAADTIQAAEMYRFAAHFAEPAEPDEDSPADMRARHELLSQHLFVRRYMREIRSRRDNGFAKVLASDDSRVGGKKTGFNPTLALVDELHAHENDNLYADLRAGLFKRGGLMVTISTAGSDPDSVLGRLRAKFQTIDSAGGNVQHGLVVDKRGRPREGAAGRLTIARSKSDTTVMLEWANQAGDDLDDMRMVKLANPGSMVTIASLEDAHEAPGITVAQFRRYRANVWSQPDDAVIAAEAWDECFDADAAIPSGASVVLAVDYARKSDSSAVAELWQRPDGRVVVCARVWARRVRAQGRPQPAAHELVDDTVIRQSVIRAHIRAVRDQGKSVVGVVYDPHLFDPEELSDQGFTMVEHPQTVARMAPASKTFYEAVATQAVAHDGDPVLRSHVTSAGAKPTNDGEWRFSKTASKRHIDALICAVMGYPLAHEGPVMGGFEW